MLTIAGSGVNLYSFKEIEKKVIFSEYDLIVADLNFNTPENNAIISDQTKVKYLQFSEIKTFLKDKLLKKENILYIVTGSPTYYSSLSIIKSYLKSEISGFEIDKINIIPAESSKDYVIRGLKILENEVNSMSLHGRNLDEFDLTKFLFTEVTFLLCDERTLTYISEITAFVKDDIDIFIGSKLGSDKEIFKQIDCESFLKQFKTKDLVPYVLLIRRRYKLDQSFTPDEEFKTNAGLITKQDKRVMSLQALKMRKGLTLWDIGAGSGSVSIDAYKVFNARTVLFEKNSSQCDFIKNNLVKHKVVAAKLYEGNVLDNYKKAIAPDRIFIGGGSEEVLSRIEEFYTLLKDKGVLVANIVALENLAVVVNILNKTDYKYEIRSINLNNFNKMSRGPDLSIGTPARTLFQVIITK